MAQRKNVRTPVIYKLYYEQENGEWVVIDFSIDDVSTADSYQRQFQNIIRKDGFDKLMNNLRKRASR
jgi:phospholipid transport system substrate-binding protein